MEKAGDIGCVPDVFESIAGKSRLFGMPIVEYAHAAIDSGVTTLLADSSEIHMALPHANRPAGRPPREPKYKMYDQGKP